MATRLHGYTSNGNRGFPEMPLATEILHSYCTSQTDACYEISAYGVSGNRCLVRNKRL